MSVCQEIEMERDRQDKKWGGPVHDDQHRPMDWERWIKTYVAWARQMAEAGSYDKYRRRMVQVAALAVAAVESLDRRIARAEQHAEPDGCPHCGMVGGHSKYCDALTEG